MKNRAKRLCLCLFVIFLVSFAQAKQTTTPAQLDAGNVGTDILNTELLSIYPTTIEFGDVDLGSLGMGELVLSSSRMLRITSLSISGSSNYTIPNMPALPYILTPAAELVLAIEFAPLSVAEFNGILEITHDAGAPQQVSLHGFGVDLSPPMITTYETDYDFGEVPVGSYDYTANFYVSLTPEWVALHGTGTIYSIDIDNNYNFFVDSISNMETFEQVETPIVLSATDELSILVVCSPMDEGDVFGELNITCEDGISHTIYLSATGVRPGPRIEVLPNPVIINVLAGSVGTGEFYVKNFGDEELEWEIDDDDMPSWLSFSLMEDEVDSGDSLLINVEVDATILDPGSYDVTFVVESNDLWTNGYWMTVTVNVDPSGPHIEMFPDPVIIEVVEGSVGTGEFYVKNTGDGVLEFTIQPFVTGAYVLPAWLTFSPMTGNVNSGDSLLVNVQADAATLVAGRYIYHPSVDSNDDLAYDSRIGIYVNVSSPPQPLEADFHADILTGHPPFMVNFIDESLSDSTQPWSIIDSWKWDFDNDGVFDSFEQNPSYTYTAPGVYSVRLVIGTNTGATSSKLRANYISMVNSAPVVENPLNAIMMGEDTQWSESIRGVFRDPDNDFLTLSCQGSQHLIATVIGDAFLTLDPAPDWYGVETIVLKATDPFGASVTHEVMVTVYDINDAPILSIPSDLYFIRGSVYMVDFASYIHDPDNPHSELSLQIIPLDTGGDISFAYTPNNTPNTLGQLTVDFTSPSQVASSASFSIDVSDNVLRLIATATFTVHVIEHFVPQVAIGDTYEFTGQTVAFTDATLGNPDHWLWEFGDGSSSELQNPDHQYLASGTFDVRLTLGNSQVPEEDRQIFIPSMITLSGTAVTVTDIPDTWTILGSPYNLFGDVVIDNTETVVMEDDIVVNLFSEEPLEVLGAISATGVRFQSQADGGKWGGLKFSGSGLREPSSLIDCEIIDALLPVDISTQSPVINNLYIAVSDTTVIANGAAIRLFESSCQIDGAQIVNYQRGITIDGQSPGRATPTLSNIRVRNASNTQRTEGQATTGVTLKSFATVTNLEVDNYSIGILIGSDNMTLASTPTLSNIRVRNSSNTQRSVLEGTGIMITGNAAPSLTDVNVSEVANGIVIENVRSSVGTTPTLTNIRVRNSSNTQRSITNGLVISNTPTVLISDAWFDDFANGITIQADNRATSTPTLSNIRVRNASNTQRTEATGITITGSVFASFSDVEIEDYYNGISYSMTTFARASNTVTLSNIRVRNSSNTQRQLSSGAVFSGLGDLRITDMEIEDFGMGLKITASDTRATTTPTLSNIRVRNASNTQREESTGIYLGQGVLGTMEDSVVEEAGIGIQLAEGNQTLLTNNQIFNCKTGLKAAGTNPLPIKKQLFVVEAAYLIAHPLLDFCAIDLTGSGPWEVAQNTISGYKKGVKASNAQVDFHSNILWTTGLELIPFINNLNTSYIQNRYNNIYQLSGLFPGAGNINSTPMFMELVTRDFSLHHNSPCIDAGNPDLPLDPDGSISDMGSFCYLHRASASTSTRFVTTGTQVDFTNTSWGHGYPYSQAEWSIIGSGSAAGTDQDYSYTFDSPGVYDLRLRMQSGSLIDEKVYAGMVVVSSHQLMAPQNPALQKAGSDIVFTWEAVTHTVEGNAYNVPFYLVYKSGSPDGFYDFIGSIDSPQTSFTDLGAALEDKAFYLVLGFTGTRTELLRFIETTPQISRTGARR